MTERAIEQVSDDEFFELIDPEANSVAVIGIGVTIANKDSCFSATPVGQVGTVWDKWDRWDRWDAGTTWDSWDKVHEKLRWRMEN